jgi:hypothetical protein
LQGLPRLFLGKPDGREFAQFVIDERQKLCGSGLVALFDGGENAGDVADRKSLC